MKKMNFYFNPSRCCGLFFAMAFMLFSSVMSFAQITAVTSVATQPANCNGTSGTITGVVTVVASGVNTSVTVTAGAVSSGSILIPAGTTTANYSLTLPAGCPGAGVSHTPSATLISSVTGSVINTVAAPARTLTIPADVTPPVGPATANFSSPSLCSFSPTFAGAGTQTVTTNFGVTHTENDCIAACNVITSVAGVPGVVVPGPGGTATFNMTTTNSAGLTTTTVVTITFTNHAPVAATCPTPQAFTTASCASPTMVVNFTEPTFTDADIACDVLVIDRFGQAPGSTFTVGTHTIRYVATDNAGATATCNVTVTVAAPAPPALVGGSITVTSPVQLTGCNTTGTLTYTLNPPTGGCGLLVLENLTGLPTGSIVAPGTYNISATWRDAAGQVSAPATASITILPSTTCSGVVIQNVTKVDADCNTNNGSININSLGSTNNGSICYFLRVEKESTTNNLALGAIAVTPGNTSITGLPPGNYTITGQIYNCVSGLIIDVRVNTITIGVKPDVTAPVLANCPANIVQSVNCGQLATINYTAPTVTDNCSAAAQIAVTQTGPVANSRLSAGVYPVIYTAVDAAGNSSTCQFTITVTTIQPTSLTCLGAVNVTIGNPLTCEKQLTVNDVLPNGSCLTGTALIEVKRGNTWGSSLLTRNDIGKTLDYRVTINGLMCWGTITVEDKTPPTIVNPIDISLTCLDANKTALLPTVTSPSATNTGTGVPTVTDCSTTTYSYRDVMVASNNGCQLAVGSYPVTGATPALNVVVAANDNVVMIVARFFTAVDAWGNKTESTVPQIIKITRTPVVYTNPADLTKLCTGSENFSVAATMAPLVTAYSASCGYMVMWTRDDTIKVCQSGNRLSSYKIVRYYRVLTSCAGEAGFVNMAKEHSHLLTVNDVAPTLSATWIDYTPKPASESICETKTLQGVNIAPNSGSGAITVSARALPTMCNAAAIDIDFTAADACSGIRTASVSDNRLTATYTNSTGKGKVTGTVMSVNGADVKFDIVVEDSCGNFGKIAVTVKIADLTAPAAVCDGVEVTVNNPTTAVVRPSNIDRGSTDNCGIESMFIKKASDTQFCNEVTYTCADAGLQEVDVLYIDYAGNYTICRSWVNVKAVGNIMCVSPANTSVPCTTTTLPWGTPTIMWDGCGVVGDPVVTTTPGLVVCGTSTISSVRTWTYTAPNGKTAVCTQAISTTPVLGYRVPKVPSLEIECGAAAETTTTTSTKPAATHAAITSQAFADSTEARILRTIVARRNGLGGTFASGVYAGQNRDGAPTCSAPLIKVEQCILENSTCKRYVQKIVLWDPCLMSMAFNENNKGISMQTNINVALATLGNLSNLTYTQDEEGRVEIYRFISIVPKLNKPTLTIAAGANCTFSATGTASSCTDNPVTSYNWTIRVGSATGAIVASGTNIASISAASLVAGTSYVLVVNGSDACGSSAAQVVSDAVVAVDNASPTINVHNKIVSIGGISGSGNGYAILTAQEITNSATDNCTPVKLAIEKGGATPATAPASQAGAITFTCADWDATTPANRTVQVRVWAGDNNNNWNYALATITLQNPDLVCGGTQFSVSGAARTENNAVVNNVTVSASANGTAVATAEIANGTFNITMPAATNVQVRAAKNNNEDATSGVTTFDIAKVSQHVLDVAKLATPYKMIAADVDKSGEIDANDMLHLRRFILKITPSLPGGNFRFIDRAYTFRDASNPFGEDFPEVVNIASLSANTAANFVAVKLGDVNDSYAALAPRSTRTLSFVTNDMNIVAGNEYTVNIAADKMDAAAFQGTFSFNGAKVKSVKAGDLNNMTDGNFGIFASAVTTSWNGKTQDASDVLAITFVANKSGKLSEMLTVNSALTQAVANDATGNEMNVNLKFNTGKVAGGEFALYQNQPNPVANETTIGFNLPKDGQARLTITAVDGKVAKVINGNYKAGYNTITVNKSDLNASGVFYYRLETADHSASKKMVIIE